MFGDYDAMVRTQRAFFDGHSIAPNSTRVALDLGSGPGFQSIALSQIGFDVLAIDTSEELLRELAGRCGSVKTLNRDFRDLSFAMGSRPELIVCMGDTLTHLGSVDEVRSVIRQTHALLVPKGRVVLTFRDLSVPRKDVDRFIPVRGDADRILTSFLEDAGDSVVVFDLLHERAGADWTLTKSCYRKIKLTKAAASAIAVEAGFRVETDQLKNGMIVVIGLKD